MKPALTVFLVLAMGALAAAEGDYPSWMGPNGNRSSDSGLELVDDIAEAKMLWRSEASIPGTYRAQYCVPATADGCVYYVHPAPGLSTPVDEISVIKADHKAKGKLDRAYLESTYRLGADDIVLCIDAETGKTKWQRRFEGKGTPPGMNRTYWATPVIADGRVYVVGTGLCVYCLDAKTGESIWESELADARAFWKRHFESWLELVYAPALEGLKAGKRYKEHYVYAGLKIPPPLLVEGVLVCTDGGGRSHKTRNKHPPKTEGGKLSLVGLDAKTGMELWRTPCSAYGPPQAWRHGDQTYAVVSNGGFICVDTRDGAVLWKSSERSGGWGTHLIHGDILLQASKSKTDKKQWLTRAYRLSQSGMEEIWQIPEGRGYSTFAVYKNHAFGVYSLGKEREAYFAVELDTGTVVKRTPSLHGNSGLCNSFLIADDRLWIGWGDYLNADPKHPDFLKQLGKKEVPADLMRNSWASPSVAQGRVFYLTFRQGCGHVVCADFRKQTSGSDP